MVKGTVRNGGEIIRVCQKSMQIEGTVHEWGNWTNKKYPGDGNYIVTGALTPISIDTKKISESILNLMYGFCIRSKNYCI